MRTLAALLMITAAGSAETRLGKPLTLAAPVSVGKVMDAPAQYTGKTVQVKGKVTEVCEMMGCWMSLADPSGAARIRIKVNDGDIVFPKDSPGKIAIAEGKLVKLDLSREQAVAAARHEAEEQGRRFNPKSVRGPKTVYQIEGSGAVLLD